MKKLNKKLISNVDRATIRFQSEIINRLRLYDFAKSAISFYCKERSTHLDGYNFKDFKEKFKLIEFQEDKEIKSIGYKEIINVGNKFIEDELADSVFVLNMSAFENWILTMLNHKLLDSKTDIFKESAKSNRKVDISDIQESSNLDELWEKIISKYLQKLPYDGMRKMLSKLIKDFGIDRTKITLNVLEKINENSLCRNLIVHNQKKVNKKYTKKCGRFAKFSERDTIKITEPVLFEQGDNLLRFMQDFRNILKRSHLSS